MTLEVSLGGLYHHISIVVEVFAILAPAEANIVSWLDNLGQLHGLSSQQSLSYYSRQHLFLFLLIIYQKILKNTIYLIIIL